MGTSTEKETQPLTFNSLADFERLCKGVGEKPKENEDGTLSLIYNRNGITFHAAYIPSKKTPWETFDLKEYIDRIRGR